MGESKYELQKTKLASLASIRTFFNLRGEFLLGRCLEFELHYRPLQMYYEIFSSPVGPLLLQGDDSTLKQLSFLKNRNTKPFIDPSWCRRPDNFVDARAQLVEYFQGERREFDIELDFGVAEDSFSVQVWRELQRIPYGETRSYRDVANNIGRTKAFRAVGQANHRNPIAIVVPCHRVIGSDGTLTGFGGGLATKKYLLDMESRVSQSKTVKGNNNRVKHLVST